MKDGWDRYASKKRFKQKGYLRKHCQRGSLWKASQAGSGDSLLDIREKQEENTLLRDMLLSSGSKVEDVDSSQPTKITLEESIQWYGKVVQLTDEEIVQVENIGHQNDSDYSTLDPGGTRGRDQITQPEDSQRFFMAMQDISKKPVRNKRKAKVSQRVDRRTLQQKESND